VGAQTTGGTARYPGGTDTVAAGSKGHTTLWDVVAITGSTDVSVTAQASDEAIVDTGTGNDTLTGGLQTQVIIGNNANDSITSVRSSDVYTGTGNNIVDLTNGIGSPVGDKLFAAGTGHDTVNVGAGVDTVNIYGGNDDINLTDQSIVNLRTASDITVNGGAGVSTVTGGGNDTITVGSAPVYIVDKGSATVLGGGNAGGFTFRGTMGDDSVVAGSGATTLYGGSGKEFFVGGSGDLTFHAGAGDNTVVAGTGSESLYGGTKAASNYYDFENGAGTGNVSIYGYQNVRDVIHLGSGESTVTAGSSGKDYSITLSDGTHITLVGVGAGFSGPTYG
jgi:Ca2+-binding RTX toxin-like protein